MSLQPASAKVYVGDRRRVASFRWLTEVQGGHDHAATGDCAIDTRVVGPGAVVPRSSVDVEQRWKGTIALWLVDACEPGLSIEPLVLDVLLDNLKRLVAHGSTPFFGSDRTWISGSVGAVYRACRWLATT